MENSGRIRITFRVVCTKELIGAQRMDLVPTGNHFGALFQTLVLKVRPPVRPAVRVEVEISFGSIF